MGISCSLSTAWTGSAPLGKTNLLPMWHAGPDLHSWHPAAYTQVKLIREKFQAALGDDARLVDINTIDGFQVLLCSMLSVYCALAAMLQHCLCC